MNTNTPTPPPQGWDVAALGTPAAMRVLLARALPGKQGKRGCDASADGLPWSVAARHGLRIPAWPATATTGETAAGAASFVDETFAFALGLAEPLALRPPPPTSVKALLKAKAAAQAAAFTHQEEGQRQPQQQLMDPGCAAREHVTSAAKRAAAIAAATAAAAGTAADAGGGLDGGLGGFDGGFGSASGGDAFCAPLFRVQRFFQQLRSLGPADRVREFSSGGSARGGSERDPAPLFCPDPPWLAPANAPAASRGEAVPGGTANAHQSHRPPCVPGGCTLPRAAWAVCGGPSAAPCH